VIQNELIVIKLKKKTRYLQFKTKNCLDNNITISYRSDHIINTLSTKFLGQIIVETLSWKCHIHHLVTKLGSACYAIKIIMDLMSQETLRMIYFSYVHSVMTYDIIFCGNLPHSINNLKIQKRIIRNIMNAKTRDSCRELFTVYICVIIICHKYRDQYKSNQESHSVNTRCSYSTNLHLPTSSLALYQRGHTVMEL
jgi:hypothetical protein